MDRKQEKKSCPNRFEFFPQPVIPPAEEDSHGVSLVVVFTTPAATLTALQHAAAWADQLGAHLRIIVPHVVPYPLPLDRPSVAPEFRLRPLLKWCEEKAIEARIEVQLCRHAGECLRQGLTPSSLVLLGTRRGWRPFTSETRLIKYLQRAGHQVLAVSHRR